MIKNAIVYRVTHFPLSSHQELNNELSSSAFEPCAPSQEKSIGWAPPRGEENGQLIEVVGGQWVLKLITEIKAVPSDVVTRKADERIKQIEGSTGRKPGKKETSEIKDDIKLELLPMAFAKQSSTTILIVIEQNEALLVIEASSQARADDAVTMLIKCIPGLAVKLIETKVSPTAAMSEWLISQEPPVGFTVDRECELKAADESKATIKYGKHPLDTDEVKAYVESGKLPTKLALTWDSRVSFVLTEGMQIKKIEFLDVVFEGKSRDKADGFDADVAITTGELRNMLPDLLDALGGEVITT